MNKKELYQEKEKLKTTLLEFGYDRQQIARALSQYGVKLYHCY